MAQAHRRARDLIKRIQFLSRRAGLLASEFESRLLNAFEIVYASPVGTPPLRAVACIVAQVAAAEAPHDAIVMEWFAGPVPSMPLMAAEFIHPIATAHLLAEEAVLRGADWLERRWTTREVKWKHMALACRASGLSAAEFSDRWRNRPGRIGGASGAPAIEIPAAAKGCAYVQNHPAGSAPHYDAINEVYFDDLQSLQARLDFFETHDPARADADLVSEAKFLVVREHVII